MVQVVVARISVKGLMNLDYPFLLLGNVQRPNLEGILHVKTVMVIMLRGWHSTKPPFTYYALLKRQRHRVLITGR